MGSNQTALETEPYTIRNVKGVRVGVIGMANISSLNSIVEGGNSLQATPLEQNEVVRAYVELLRPVTDLIVIVSHLGLHEDQDVIQGYEAYYEYGRARSFTRRAKNPWQVLEWFGPEGDEKSVVRVFIPGVAGVDVVLGGHLHVVLNPPQLLADPAGRKVVLAHSGAFSKYVGRLDLVVKMPEALGEGEGAEVVTQDYRVFPLDALWCDDAMRDNRFNPPFNPFRPWNEGEFIQLPAVREAIQKCKDQEDRDITQLLQPYIVSMDFKLQLTNIFSYAPRDVQRRNNSSGGDSPLGNIAADSMRKRRRVEAEMALTNSLGIRDNLYSGVVTQESMFNVFPFENTINIMYLSGKEMQEMFNFVAERSSERGCVSQAQISGARFTMDCAQVQLNDLRIPCATANRGSDCPAENREGHAPWQCLEDESSVGGEGRCYADPGTDIEINGKPLDPNGTYKIAVNDYIAKGGSGFNVLKRNTTRIETGISLRDSLIGYMQSFCTCEDILAGKETSATGTRCGNLINGEWKVDDQVLGFCRAAKNFENDLSVKVGDCTCGDLLQRGFDPKGCNAEGIDTAEKAQRACIDNKRISDTCACGDIDGDRGYNPQGCNAPEALDTALEAQAFCAPTSGPYTGRCSCRDVLAGTNPVCGNVTPQLRNFCKKPASMGIADAVEDGRIGRRVK